MNASFRSVEDYMNFMRDPSRVVRLEWRKLRQPKSHGLTSHSWLEAYLLDGRHVRYDFFSDHGLTESLQAGPDPKSELYEQRAAAAHEFSTSLTAQMLRDMAQKAGSRPYSLLEYNCHHFVLEVWNSSVIDILQRSHYPDRVKTSVLSGVEGSLHTWFGGFMATAFSSTSNRADAQSNRAPGSDNESSPHARLSMRKEEGSRISGDFVCLQRNANGFDQAERAIAFASALQSGAVFLLEAGGTLIPTGLPPQHAQGEIWKPCEMWAASWLPSVDKDAMARVIERIGKKDIVDVVAKILKPESATTTPWNPLSFVSSLGSYSLGYAAESIVDVCYVVLKSQELRLAIYACVRPNDKKDGCPWRLRLLSGDMYSEQDMTFTYTLRDIPENALLTSATDILQEELPVLRTALSTEDWGFVTLL
jgi:hypothetical protein